MSKGLCGQSFRAGIAAFASAVSWAVFPPVQGADCPPNFIILLADDLAYHDLSCFGQRQFSTPNIDRLANEGRVFSGAFAGGAWCAPSRTSLLTGLDDRHFAPLQTDAAGNGTRFRPTLAEMLRPAGYAACAVGKWHMLETDGGRREGPPVPAQMPWNRGFDFCRIGFLSGWNYHFPHELLSGDGQSVPVPENRSVSEQLFRDYCGVDHRFAIHHSGEGLYNAEGLFVDGEGNDVTRLRCAEDLYREAACSFIDANRDRPFLLYYATPLIHFPVVAKRIDGFAGKPSGWTVMHKAYAASVEEFDRSVGAVMGAVRNSGLESNTVVFVMSDNGYTAGYNFPEAGAEWGPQLAMWDDVPLFANRGPWNRGKHITTAGGLMVPFIAWGGGRVLPGRTSRAVCFADLMPTMSEFAGAPLPGLSDGVSFVPLLEGRDPDQPLHPPMRWSGDTCLHASMNDDWAAGTVRPARPPPHGAFRPDAVLLDERWFAMVFGTADSPVVRLFDLPADPGQYRDVAAAHPEIVRRASVLFAEAVRRETAGFE